MFQSRPERNFHFGDRVRVGGEGRKEQEKETGLGKMLGMGGEEVTEAAWICSVRTLILQYKVGAQGPGSLHSGQ